MKKGVKLTPYGKKVCKRLIDRNMTQAELAKSIECSNQYLWDILHGFKSGKKYLNKINLVLDIDEEVRTG